MVQTPTGQIKPMHEVIVEATKINVDQGLLIAKQHNEIERLRTLLDDVFANPEYLTDSYYRAHGRKLRNRYNAMCNRQEVE